MATFNLGTTSGLITRSDAAITVSNSTTKTTLISMAIAGSSMTRKNKLKFAVWSTLSTRALLPGNLTITIEYGTAVLTLGGGALALTGGASATPFVISGRMSNKGGTSSQYLFGQITQAASTLTLGGPINQANSFPTIDSTADQVFKITAQFQTADVGNILTLQDCEVELS